MLAAITPPDLGTFVVDPMFIMAITGFFIPFLTAFVNKHNAPAWLNSVVTMFFSALTTVLATATLTGDGVTVISKWTVVYGLINFIIAVGAYKGFWKPFSITNRTVLPNHGLTAGQKD